MANCEDKLNTLISDISIIKSDVSVIKRDVRSLKISSSSSGDTSSTLDSKIDKLLTFMGVK